MSFVQVSPEILSVEHFVDRLRGLDTVHGDPRVLDLLLAARPDPSQIARLARFDGARYARNRIFQNDDFEALLLCWEPGQRTRIHDHDGQHGWVSVLAGRLEVEDFAIDDGGGIHEGRPVRLTGRGCSTIEAGDAVVETVTAETIHRVGASGGRAISLHLYSRPLRSLMVFDESSGSFVRHEL